VSEAGWSCLKGSGNTFAVVRVYRSSGSVDPAAAATIKNARAAGIAYVDGYIFPCPKCGDGAGQARAAVNNLRAEGAQFGMLWLDIEGTQYWYADHATNINFLQELANGLNAAGVNWGVYTSSSQWTPITGGWTGMSNKPLWYPHYDNSPSFGDFRAFGGWGRPNIKQYAGDVTRCGVGVDLNWYP